MTQPDKLLFEDRWENVKKEKPSENTRSMAAWLMPMLLWNPRKKSDG